MPDEQFAAPSRHEHTCIDFHSHAAEFDPTEDVFERHTGGAMLNHTGQVAGVCRLVDKESRLVLGEDTPRGAQGGDDCREREVRTALFRNVHETPFEMSNRLVPRDYRGPARRSLRLFYAEVVRTVCR